MAGNSNRPPLDPVRPEPAFSRRENGTRRPVPATVPARYERYDIPLTEEPAQQPNLLVEYFYLVRRHKGTVILSAFLGALAGILLTLPQQPIYQARTTLEVQQINDNFLNMKSVDPNAALQEYSSDAYIQTHIKVMQSDTLV